MTGHSGRMAMVALIAASLVGWFGRVAWDAWEWIRPVESMMMLVVLIMLARWLVGRVD